MQEFNSLTFWIKRCFFLRMTKQECVHKNWSEDEDCYSMTQSCFCRQSFRQCLLEINDSWIILRSKWRKILFIFSRIFLWNLMREIYSWDDWKEGISSHILEGKIKAQTKRTNKPPKGIFLTKLSAKKRQKHFSFIVCMHYGVCNTSKSA